MARFFRSISVDEEILNLLRIEIEKNRELINVTEESLTKDHMLWIRSLSPLISSIDPNYNGGDTSTLADKWYRAEDNASFDFQEFQARMKLIRTILKYRRAKITEQERDEHCYHSTCYKYVIVQVPPEILKVIQMELPRFTEFRNHPITPEVYDSIAECESLIDAIDTQYRGINHSTIPQGLSLAEQWYQVLTDYEEYCEIDGEDYEDIFERYYTILFSLEKYKRAVVLCYSAQDTKF